MSRVHEAFGPHLALTGSGSPPGLLRDVGLVYRFLDRMPAEIGMTQITPPFIYRFQDGGQGISGVVLIAESHISIHTYPEKGALLYDVFSCKDFEIEAAVRAVVQTFQIKEYRQEVLDRGLEFGRNVPAAVEHLVRERRGWCGAGGG